MDIKFEKFNYPIELQQQRRMFVECFSENRGTPVETTEHYHWKFKSFPTQGTQPAYEYVAKLDNELIGYYAAIPYEYYINKKLVRVAMVCDVMTSIKARGKGVFTRLGRYSTNQFKKEGLAFSVGYPIRPEVIPGHRKAGWEFPFQIPMYGKFLKFNSFLRARKLNFLSYLANIVIRTYNSALNLGQQKSAFVLVERYNGTQVSQIAGIDVFIDKWRSENPIALNKSVEFYKWRLGAPGKKYEIILLRNKESHQIQAFAIVRALNKEGVPCLGILDFCMLHQSQHLSRLLMWEIEKTAKAMNCELILMMMMKHKARAYKIKRAGFMTTPYSFSFILKQFDYSINPSFLNKKDNWNLMWIDSDDL